MELQAGSYDDRTVSADPAKTSADDVIFEPAPGAAVTLSNTLHISARHLELRRLRFAGVLWIDAGAQDLTLRDNTLKAFDILSNGAEAPGDISLIGGSVGPAPDDSNRIASNGTATTASPTNILIDDVRIHDFTQSQGSGAHVECLQVWAADGLTIRNSTFENCEVFDIFLQKLPGGAAGTPSNVTIENNFFDCCRSGYFAIRLADHPGTSWNDVTIRNNSSNKAINLDGGVPYSNVKVTGNIAPELSLYTGATGGESAVPSGVTVDYNVWYAGSRRGPHDQVAPAGFIDPGALDFHLSAGAAAIGAGDPAGSPARDIDGDSRSDAAPDVGADEFRTAPSPPDTTGSPVRRWRRRFPG